MEMSFKLKLIKLIGLSGNMMIIDTVYIDIETVFDCSYKNLFF